MRINDLAEIMGKTRQEVEMMLKENDVITLDLNGECGGWK